MIAGQERFQILFNRHTAYGQQYRPGKIGEQGRWRRVGREGVQVDPSPPFAHLGDAMGAQLLPDRASGHKHRARRTMEPSYIAPEPGGRQTSAPRYIIGEMRVIGSGERHARSQAPAPRGQAKRPFRRQMHGVGRKIGYCLPNDRRSNERQPNFRIGRTGDGAVEIRRNHLHHMPRLFQFTLDRQQSPHDAVDLRRPCVGHDDDPHRTRPGHAAIRTVWPASRAAISSAQCNISIRPSKCSTKAVHPSTQSPSL